MIRGRVEPEETVPILPFPATDPRRADQLIDEYDHLLFGDWSVDPHNIVYAAERNPFDVCAHIISAASRYEEAFKIVAPVRIIVSSHAGKLLSVGCFLAAAQNRQIAVAHVQPTAYDLRSLALEAREPKHLVEMWLAGEVYA